MSIPIFPAPVSPIASPIVPMPVDVPFIADTVPFTSRSGATFAEVFYGYKNYLDSSVIPTLDGDVKHLVEKWNEYGEALAGAVNDGNLELANDVNAKLNEQRNNVVDALSSQASAVNEQLTQQNESIVASITEMTNYVDESVQSIINSTIDVSDPVIAGVFDANGTFREKTDQAYADKDVETTVISGRLSADSVSSSINKGVTDAAMLYSGVIYVESFKRENGETTDSGRINRAISACSTFGARILEFAAIEYVIDSACNVTVSNLTLLGAGEKATTVRVVADVVGFNVTGHYVSLDGMMVIAETVNRANYPVVANSVNKFSVRRCYFEGATGARRSGVSFVGGSMGVVDECTFNHACIRIATWDVMVTNTWIWAMSCEFGVGIYDGAGNTSLNLVHVVPPLTSTAYGRAGILIDGASGKSFSTSLVDIYLDGNPELSVRTGIYVGDGSSTVTMIGVKANRMDADCIVVDSAFNVTIIAYSGHTNNQLGNGAREIFVTQTGTQPTERIVIMGATCLMTSAVTGTAGPAIEVSSSVSGSQVDIVDFAVKQPDGGGGYSLPEVKVPKSGDYPIQNMSGRGKLSLYKGTGSIAVASGATGVTINLGGASYPMAYRPRPGQIVLEMEGAYLPQHRIQYSNDNTVYVAFATALSADATLHWQAALSR